jgi:hypothetical protein
MTSLHMDLNIQYKEQDLTLISKTIEKVRYFMIFYYYLAINAISFYSLKKGIPILQLEKGPGSSKI